MADKLKLTLFFLFLMFPLTGWCLFPRMADRVYYAAYEGNFEELKQLIAGGVKINARTAGSDTLLHLAVQSGNADCVKLLISEGSKVNERNCLKETPLHLAAVSGNAETIRLLIEAGADVNALDEDKMKPLMRAITNSKVDNRAGIIKALVDGGADINERLIIDKKQMATWEQYWKNLYGYDPAKKDDNSLSCYLKIKENLFALKEKDGVTVLAFICAGQSLLGTSGEEFLEKKNTAELVEYLTQKGADVNLATKSGITALIYAAYNGRSDLAEILIKHGADVNHKDSSGSTALMYAVQQGNRKTVKILLEKGADSNLLNKDNHTALNYAEFAEFSDITENLKTAGADSSLGDKVTPDHPLKTLLITLLTKVN